MSTLEGLPPMTLDLTEGSAVGSVGVPNDTPPVRPQLEGVFDPGELFYFQGHVQVEKSHIHWNLLVPENRIYDGVVAFAPGHFAVEGASEKPAIAHAKEGIMTAWYGPGRKGENLWDDMFKPEKLHALTVRAVFGAIKDRGPEIVNEVPEGDKIDLDRHAVVDHSRGGLAGVGYGLLETGSTEALLHKAACGYGHPKPLEVGLDVLRGAIPSTYHDIIPTLLRRDIAVNFRNLRDFARYPRFPRIVSETVGCMHVDSRDATARLIGRGVLIDFESYEHDILVQSDPTVSEFVTSWREMPGAGHMAPIKKAPAVARGSAQVLISLN